MKFFLSTTLFAAMIGFTSAVDQPQSRLSPEVQDQLRSLHQGFSAAQSALDAKFTPKSHTRRQLFEGAVADQQLDLVVVEENHNHRELVGAFCESQVAACEAHTDGMDAGAWPDYLEPMVGDAQVDVILNILPVMITVGTRIAELLGLSTVGAVLGIMSTVLDVITKVLSRTETLTLEVIFAELQDIMTQTQGLFPAQSLFDDLMDVINQVIQLIKDLVGFGFSGVFYSIEVVFGIIGAFLQLFIDLYQAILGVLLGGNDRTAECHAEHISCAYDAMVLEVVPDLVKLAMLSAAGSGSDDGEE